MSDEKWDKRYLRVAREVSRWSKDHAKVGAVIVRDNRIVATGFNGFPSAVLDKASRLANDEEKLQMIVHAEENAVLVACSNARGGTVYVHGKPVCPRCAGTIIQAGIRRVVATEPDREKAETSKWDKWGFIALQMFAEAGVQFHGKKISSPKNMPVRKLKKANGDSALKPSNGRHH